MPDAVVCVATIKAIKYHGGAPKDKILEEDMQALEKGMSNLYQHVDNLRNKFGLNVIVAVNRYNTDLDKELEFVTEKLKEKGIPSSISEGWAKGGDGAKDLAEKIVNLCKMPNNFKYTYDLNDSIQDKIKKVSQNIYGAEDVVYTDEALKSIEKIEKLGYGNLPVCIAKTQYSFSDDQKNIEGIKPYNITVRDVELKAGSGFIVVLSGKIFTMPGLPKIPAAEKIDIDENGNIQGIF